MNDALGISGATTSRVSNEAHFPARYIDAVRGISHVDPMCGDEREPSADELPDLPDFGKPLGHSLDLRLVH